MRSKTTRGEGLVPRWGGGGAWQNPPCQFDAPSHNSNFSYLGVPATTGMGDWYENDVTRFRKCFGVPEIFRIVIPAKAGIQKGWGWGNVVRGLVPRWGRGGAWQNPRCQFAVPNHNSGFSHLGTKMRLNGFRVRQRPPHIRHSREGGNPRTNIPRKNVNRDTTTYVHTATPLRLSGESTPEPRYGAGIQRGVGGANFHTLACPRKPQSNVGVAKW